MSNKKVVYKLEADISSAKKNIADIKQQTESATKDKKFAVKVEDQASGPLREIANEAKKTELWFDSLTESANNMRRTFTAGMIGSIISGFQSLLGIITSITAAIGGMIQWVYEAGKQAMRTRLSFQTMMQDIQAGNKMYEDLVNFANTTPFGDGAVQAGRLLLAMGIEAKNVLPTMQAVGNAVASMGGSDEQLLSVARALGQIQSKGKLSAEEMNQLAEQGINGFGLLAKATGVSEQELRKLSEGGKLLSNDVMPVLIKQLGDDFAGAMDKISETSGGKFDNLAADIQTNIAKIGVWMEPFFSWIADLSKWAAEQLFWIGEKLGGIVEWVGKFGNLLAKIPGISQALTLISSIVSVLWDAVKKFFDWLGEVFGAMAQGFDKLAKQFDEATKPFRDFVSWAENGIRSLLGLETSADKAAAATADLSKEADKGSESIKSLTQQAESFTAKMTESEIMLSAVENRVSELSKAKTKLNEDFAEWKISLDEYNKKMQENEKEMIEARAVLDEYKRGLEIVQDHQLGYIEKIEKMNALKLNPAAFNALLEALREAETQAYKTAYAVAAALQSAAISGSVGKWIVHPSALPGTTKSPLGYKNSVFNLEQKMKHGDQAVQKWISPMFDREVAKLEERESALKEIYDAIDKAKKEVPTTGTGKKSGGGGGKSKKETEAEKQAKEKLKNAVKALENQEKALSKVMDQQRKKREKMTEAERKWAETVKQEHEKVQSAIKKLEEQYDKTIAKLNEDHEKKQKDTIRDAYKKLLDEKEELEKAIKEDEYQIFKGDGYEESKDEKKLKKVKEQISKLTEKFKDYKTTIDEVDNRFKVDKDEREYYDFLQEINAEEEKHALALMKASQEMMKKREEVMEREKVLNFFENGKEMRGALFDSHLETFRRGLTTDDAKSLVDKLAQERKNITIIRDEKIAAETYVSNEVGRLQQALHDNQMAMIAAQKSEYNSLIEKINEAIRAARALAAASRGGGRGFATGGYTGDGGVFEPAGIVHKGEYVIPQHVLGAMNRIMPTVLPAIEKMRTANQMNTTHITHRNKSVNINGPIQIRDDVDFRQMLSRVQWEM